MALAEEGSWSGLNPAAPTFVPAAYRRVEDFSPEWWNLVLTSPCFRDYWLSLFPDGQYDVVSEDEEASFVDDDDVFLPGNELGNGPQENGSALPMPRNAFKTDVEALLKDVKVPKSLKPVSPKCSAGIPKYQKKAAYYVSPKPTPMRINQPR